MSQDPSSRHQGLPTYTLELGAGESVELYEPREIPEPAADSTHVVAASDRLDLLANRYFGDPFQFWRIADANPALTPEDVLDPGARIAIPTKK